VKMTTQLHPVPRLRMRGAIPALTIMPSWRDALVMHKDDFRFHLAI
jgi:hypothetical protein